MSVITNTVMARVGTEAGSYTGIDWTELVSDVCSREVCPDLAISIFYSTFLYSNGYIVF